MHARGGGRVSGEQEREVSGHSTSSNQRPSHEYLLLRSLSSPTTSRLWVSEHAADGSSTSVNVIRTIPTGIPRGLRDSMVCKVESSDRHCAKQQYGAGWWQHPPLVPVLWREGQLDICEVDTSLAYKVRSRTVRVLHKETVSKQNKQCGTEEIEQAITEKLRPGDCSKSLDHQGSGKPDVVSCVIHVEDAHSLLFSITLPFCCMTLYFCNGISLTRPMEWAWKREGGYIPMT